MLCIFVAPRRLVVFLPVVVYGVHWNYSWLISTHCSISPGWLLLRFLYCEGEGKLSWFCLKSYHCMEQTWDGRRSDCPSGAGSEQICLEVQHVYHMWRQHPGCCLCASITQRGISDGLGTQHSTHVTWYLNHSQKKGQHLPHGNRGGEHFPANKRF